MAKELLTTAIQAPGFLGLNTQEAATDLSAGFALQARNCVIDKLGRLAARKGYQEVTDKLGGVANANANVSLKGCHVFTDFNGVETFLSWNATKFYKGEDDLTLLTPTTADTITTGNWQAATLNDHCYFFQRGYLPLVYTNDGVPDTFESISVHTGVAGTPPKANTVISAYGRLWAADTDLNKTIVYFTDVLDGTNWSTGSAGSIDIAAVLTKGADSIVALGAHNGFLVIFCKRHIIVYGDGDNFQTAINTTTLNLVEVIDGIGCVSRDSVQNTGEDIIFLSETGVRSLNRTVQEKSQPINNISFNIRDDIIRHLEAEQPQDIRSVFSPRKAFYLLLFPSANVIFCFDTRGALENGGFRVTQWDNVGHTNFVDSNEKLYFTNANGLCRYFGFRDNDESYRMVYNTSYFDFDMPNMLKIVKRIGSTVIGGTGQTYVIKLGYDYATIGRNYPFQLTSSVTYEYNVDEYDIAEFTGGLKIERIQAPVGGDGTIIQMGIEAEIDGFPFSIQRMSIYGKQGKLL